MRKREKGRDLTESYDKSPYTDRKIQKVSWQQKNATKTSITRRFRTVLGRSAGVIAVNLTGVDKPVYERSTFPLIAKVV